MTDWKKITELPSIKTYKFHGVKLPDGRILSERELTEDPDLVELAKKADTIRGYRVNTRIASDGNIEIPADLSDGYATVDEMERHFQYLLIRKASNDDLIGKSHGDCNVDHEAASRDIAERQKRFEVAFTKFKEKYGIESKTPAADSEAATTGYRSPCP